MCVFWTKHGLLKNDRKLSFLLIQGKEPVWRKSRGVEQRNLGLDWLRRHHMTMQGKGEGDVVYFGDDDNTYDIELFNEIRATKKLSVWPVGICGGLRWEGPVCDDKGTVVDWHRSWAKSRPFPIDFAGKMEDRESLMVYFVFRFCY